MVTLILLTIVLLVALICILVVGLPVLVVLADIALGVGTIFLVVTIFRLPGIIFRGLRKKKDN